MSNYSNLKSAIQEVIKTNGHNEITGQLLQSELLSMITTLGYGYQFMGVANPNTIPGTPDAKVFYLAYEAGTYTNFGNIVVTGFCVLKYVTGWSKDDIPISSGGGTNFTLQEDDLAFTGGTVPKLRFANRINGVNIESGLDYFILREDISFQNQVTVGNTIYEIRYDFDLDDAEGENPITIPSGCILLFNGGKVENGSIVFQNTIVKSPKFANCYYSGTIITDYIDDRDWTSLEDYSTLYFLLKNSISLGIKADFYRDYSVDLDPANGYVSGQGFTKFENLTSGAYLDFHGHSITNDAEIPGETGRREYIKLINVNDITISNAKIYDTRHNSQELTSPKGVVFVEILGDCAKINLLNIYQEGGDNIIRTGVYLHDPAKPEETPAYGLTNSILELKTKNTAYGVTIETGDNLSVYIDTTNPRRGAYLGALSNSNIIYRGYNAHVAKCHILLKDSIFKYIDESGNIIPDIKGCSNINIYAEIPELLSTEVVINLTTIGNADSFADFSFRSTPCYHSDIVFSGNIHKWPTKSLISAVSNSGLGDPIPMFVNNFKVFGFKNIPVETTSGDYVKTCQIVPANGAINIKMSVEDCKFESTATYVSSTSGQFIVGDNVSGEFKFYKSDIQVQFSTHQTGEVSMVFDRCYRTFYFSATSDKSLLSFDDLNFEFINYRQQQAAFSVQDHEYKIRNNIVLFGDLMMPTGCILHFLGGSFPNRRVFGAQTKIIGNPIIYNKQGTWFDNGATTNRPTLSTSDSGITYFDTDLGKMIVWNGTAWVNMDGSALS